jgi:hypothetical protein
VLEKLANLVTDPSGVELGFPHARTDGEKNKDDGDLDQDRKGGHRSSAELFETTERRYVSLEHDGVTGLKNHSFSLGICSDECGEDRVPLGFD